MKTNWIFVLMFLLVGLFSEAAFGQAFAPPTAPRAPRPTLSPYLNLLDRNNSPAFNYYNRVRPRQAFDDYREINAGNLQALDRRIDRNRDALLQSENSQLAPSGHPTRFMDLGGYFGAGRR